MEFKNKRKQNDRPEGKKKTKTLSESIHPALEKENSFRMYHYIESVTTVLKKYCPWAKSAVRISINFIGS